MGAILIEHWLAGAERISIVDQASISEARELVRARGSALGLSALATEKLAAAVSELAHNQLAHAVRGEVGLRATERAGVAGLEVVAADRGKGISDPGEALRGTLRAAGSLGVGLSAAARQVDELDLDIRWGAGSCISVRCFVSPVRRSELGILARAHPDETTIGDTAIALRAGDRLTLGVVDGLGHGPLAREPADRALDVIMRQSSDPVDDQLRAIHRALVGTRGAVMALARIGDRLEHAGVGNISTRVIGLDGVARPLASTAGTLGSVLPRRIHVDDLALQPGELVVMSSDGLSSRVDLTHEPAMLRQHPIVIAQHLLSRFTRGTDDAIVAVVR
jgi:anti-sigma regulatory factor (Ser/Thr protein kinase)